MRDWNKVSALAALGCLIIAAVTFAIQIYPVPQIKAYYGDISTVPVGGPKLIAWFIVAGFLLAAFAIRGAWRKPKVYDWREAFRKPQWDIVSGHSYSNKTIEVDGKSFRDCKFENVTFVFRGKAPTEFIGDTQVAGGFSVDTDDPAIMLFAKLQRFARNIPGARVSADGEVDAKGKLLDDGFKMRPLTDPAEVLASDPHMYLLEVKESVGDVSPKSIFVLKNNGGSVAHNVQIEDMIFGYKVATFPTLHIVDIGETVEVWPTIKNADHHKHCLAPVLEEAWNVAGMNEENGIKFPFTIKIRCELPNGKRRIETDVELTFSFVYLKWNREGRMNHKAFEIKKTTFKLL
jgi:hypothetical protein